MLKRNFLGAIFLTALSIAIPAVTQDSKEKMQSDNMMGSKMKSTEMNDQKMSKTTKAKHRKNRKHKKSATMDQKM